MAKSINKLFKEVHKLLSGNLPNYDSYDLIPSNYYGKSAANKSLLTKYSNMLIRIDGNVRSNVELNQWVEDAVKVIKDINPMKSSSSTH